MVQEQKKALRLQLLERLLSLTQDEIKRRSNNVEKILSEIPIYKKAHCIMGYYPLKGEVDVLEMLRKVHQKRLCFPMVDITTNQLHVFEVSDLENDFIKGPYKVLQPDPHKTKEIDARQIDVILVPGLAFDRQKNRLGRGAGCYDRFLATVGPTTTKIGIGFDFQVLDTLPVSPAHDEKVDIIVSEHFTV